MKRLFTIFFMILLGNIVVGCNTDNIIKPSPGTSIVIGQILSVNTSKPYAEVFVWLADIYRNEAGGGAYTLDTSTTQHTTTDSNGNYSFKDIKPGEYVLVFGDPMTNYFIVADEYHKPIVWSVQADQTLDVGKLKIDLD